MGVTDIIVKVENSRSKCTTLSLKKTLTYLTIIVLITSCNNDKQSVSDEITQIYPIPQLVALNTEEGYIINRVTGDSIQPIVNSLGDTIKTGVPVPVRGKVIQPGSVAKPKIVPAGEPKVVSTHLNVYEIPEILTEFPVNKDLLKTFTPGVDTSSFVMINSTGDTLPTGVPIPVKGKVVPCIQPQPVKAFSQAMKDNASINLRYLDVKEGMNSSYVKSIIEDTHGNLWIGTWNGGVSMYNGKSFTNFTKKEGLSNNTVYSMLEDSRGNLWFGTNGGGVNKYNGETFTHFTEKEGLSNNIVRSIMEDSNGNLWFGTQGGGVSKYDGKTITHITRKEGLSSNIVYSMLEDSKGNLWFGTKEGGVNMFNGTSFTHFTKQNKKGLSNNTVYSILEDSHGNLWFGTWRGVTKYDGKNFTHFREKDGLSNNVVNSIEEDNYGNLWFGTSFGGVCMYDGKTFTHYTEEEGLSNNAVFSILKDSHNNLWFGTDGGGMNVYQSESFIHFTEKEGLSYKKVNSILEDRSGNIWFGTRGRGVSMYNGETYTHFTEKEGLSNNYVYSMMEDSRGNLWFGTNLGGASMYNGETFTHFTEEEGLCTNLVYSILEDSNDNIWFGTNGGLSMYNSETLPAARLPDGQGQASFTHFTEKEGLSNNYILTIIEDRSGNLWFGTEGGGVIMYNGDTFTHITEKEGLSNNYVYSILEDRSGNIWFGTYGGGVSLYNGETFMYITEKEGLSSNYIYSIVEDSSGSIWVGTNDRLNRIVLNPDKFFKTGKRSETIDLKKDSSYLTFKNLLIYTYNEQDDLKSRGFYRNSVLSDSKNRIWWGCGKSVTMRDMNNFKTPGEPPALQLYRVEINQQFADYRHLKDSAGMEMKFNGVAKFYNYPLNLELPYNRNHLTFHFSAIDWHAPNKIKYSHKIEGFNDNWSLPTSEAKVEYRNLDHGTYTFKVRAIGKARKWSETFEYRFTIHPPWWNTWLARILYAGILFLIIYLIIQKRTENLKRRQSELKTEVENRTRELKETQSQLVQSEKMASLGVLTAGIAHEINNPINFVKNGANALDKDYKDLKKLLDGLEIPNHKKEDINYEDLVESIPSIIKDIKLGAIRTAEIVKGLHTFSRIGDTDKQLANIHEGLDSTLLLLRSKIKDNIEIVRKYDLTIPEIMCYPGQLNQVFMNILNNAIDALNDLLIDNGTAQGVITIKTGSKIQETKMIEISISDNGSGIANEIISKIFDPFFTTKKIGKGVGLGLSISHGIIKKHDGEIKVKNMANGGANFQITIPIDNEKSNS